jgi:hypothetical protein
MKTQTHSDNTILPEMDAPELLARLERYSSHAGCGIELLELIRALCAAPDAFRRDVAALCAVGLAEYDASIEAGQ